MIFRYFTIWIFLAPLSAGAVIGIWGRALGPKVCRIGVAAEIVAFAISLLVLVQVIRVGPQTIELFQLGHGSLQFALLLDRLTAVMLVHIAAISILIHLFSIRYMQQERGYTRFHSLLACTSFVLFVMVSSANLLMLYVFWQLLSWLVPHLSFNYEHAATARGAFRTFIMQRTGDVAFLAAIILAYGGYGTLDLAQLSVRAGEARTMLSLWPGGLEISVGAAVTLLIFIGAMSKSAQFPLHMWLPDYLYAPTPVTALLHAGIINAGGFLLCRLAPLYALNPNTLHIVFAVGMLTALLGSSMMLVQSDIKKTLGYSTIGQMGFMIMECGLGAYGLAIFHLIAHGLFKGTIFLNCGHVIHAARQEPRLPNQDHAVERPEFSTLTWLTGFSTTLILPLIIVLGAHGILNIPLGDSQGTAIFLFFGWATSAQAILTLYRLRAVASWKVAVIMLAALFVIVITYLLAAESFTDFLFPAPGEVAYHFRAGALPARVFDLLVSLFAAVIVVGWILIYAASHGRTIHLPQWIDMLQVRVYVLLINRLYLDALSMRLRQPFVAAIDALNRSRQFTYGAALLAVALAALLITPAHELSALPIVQWLVVALLLPLFPFHGMYVAALTRTPGYRPMLLALLLPIAGIYGLANLAHEFPSELIGAVRGIALVSALYGSLKALAQVHVPNLLAYASLAFYSALWWQFAANGTLSGAALVYAANVALVITSLLLAWLRLRRRYGDLSLDRMHGLARPMPRFAALFALLIMAAVGLPPFGLFSSLVNMLLQPALTMSPGLIVILLSWFLASWYLFRMMQRLLCGPQRGDIRYQDLRALEVTYLVALLVLLVALGAAPYGWLDTTILANSHHSIWR